MRRAILRSLLIVTMSTAGAILAAPDAEGLALVFSPADQQVELGATVRVDILATGLEAATPAEIVAAFDLDVSYDPGVIAGTGVEFGASLGDASLGEVFVDSDLSVLGLVDFAAVSLLPDATLDGLQGDTVILATLVFEALALGETALGFVPDRLFGLDVKGLGNAILDFEPVDAGRIAVIVSEPSLAALGLWLAGMIGTRRSTR